MVLVGWTRSRTAAIAMNAFVSLCVPRSSRDCCFCRPRYPSVVAYVNENNKHGCNTTKNERSPRNVKGIPGGYARYTVGQELGTQPETQATLGAGSSLPRANIFARGIPGVDITWLLLPVQAPLTILAMVAPSSHKSRTSLTNDIHSSDIDPRSSAKGQ